MLEINIPGHGKLQLLHLVSDVNGTQEMLEKPVRIVADLHK